MSGPSVGRRGAFGVACLSACAALGVGVVLAHVLPAPGGSDPELWVLSARNLSVGAPSVVPPLLPTLLRPAIAMGLCPVETARWLSVMAHVATAAVVGGWIVRRTGAVGMGLLGGLWTAGLPPVASLAGRAQPDAWVALWLVVSAITTHRWVTRPFPLRPHRLQLLAMLGLVSVGTLLRVHGLVVGLGMVCALGIGGGRLFGAGRMALGLLAILLAPAWVGVRPAWIPELPWFARIFQTVGHSGSSGQAGLPEEVGKQLASRGIDDPSAWDRVSWALQQAPDCWAWVLVGAVALGLLMRADRWIGAVGVVLLPLIPALWSWAEPRHVVVAVPVCIALWVIGLAQGGRVRAGLALVGIFAGFATLGSASFTWSRLEAEARMVESLRSFGEALCERASPGDLGAGVRAAFLFCPLPVHQPDGSGADWRTWAVGRRPLGPGWTRMSLAGQRVYRLTLSEAGVERPCQEVPPRADTPYFGSPDAPARLTESCVGPARTWRAPDAKNKAGVPALLEQRRRRPGRRP